MSLISFDQSGSGEANVGPLPLEAVQQLCCDCGFVKAGVDSSKPLAQRADTAAFFKVLGVSSVSSFRALFYSTRVPAPRPGQAPPPPAVKKKPAVTAAPAVRCALRLSARVRRRCAFERMRVHLPMQEVAAKTGTTKSFPVPDVSQYASLAASFETAHKWRIIPRPGGATMKPDDFYAILGARPGRLVVCAPRVAALI